MNANEIPEKYQTCDWLWNYGSIGLTKEHIKRLNNAINILESLNEHTDAKYLKEIKDKLLEDIPKIEKVNADAFIEKACEWIKTNMDDYIYVEYDTVTGMPTNEAHIASKKVVEDFKNYMVE